MRELAGKVAVVTGAASGIGRALSERFARAGMKVVLADVEPAPLATAARALADAGAETLGVPTDVSRADDVDALARRTLERFGAVHVVCNNAGVALAGPIWEHSLEDWRWLLGVNLWGVVHGVRTFVPLMLEAKTPGHIVNTASVAGLTSAPGLGAYNVSKHAVVTLSETLVQELRLVGARVGVSVLCPGFVQTRIADSERNRPEALADGADRPRPEQFEQMIRAAVAGGIPPAAVAEQVLDAIRHERLYVLPHPEITHERVRARMEGILRNETPQPSLALPR